MIPFKMITIRAAMVKGQHSRREDGKLPTQRGKKDEENPGIIVSCENSTTDAPFWGAITAYLFGRSSELNSCPLEAVVAPD